MNVENFNSINSDKKKFSRGMTVLLTSFGVCLHTAMVVAGVNISLSDFLIVLLILNLSANNYFTVEYRTLTFFSCLLVFQSIQTIITSKFIFPYSETNFLQLLSNMIKFFVNISYFYVGYSVSKGKATKSLLNGLLLGGLLISLVSVFLYIFKIKVPFIYFGETRLKGLMNDPNYFAFMQLATLLLINKLKNSKVKLAAIIIVSFSIILSGSKTSVIALIVITILNLINYYYKDKKDIMWLFSLFLFPLLALLVFNFFQNSIIQNPDFNRISTLFTSNLLSAVNDNGSGRINAWLTALAISEKTYGLGIGFFSYTSISSRYYGVGVIAHNTYLQMLVEWGLVFLLIAILWFIIMYFYIRKNKSVLPQFFLLFAYFSLSISLQNSRLIWLIVGIVYHVVTTYENQKKISI